MSEGLNTVKAHVRSIEGSFAIVEVEQGGCGRCHEEGGCGGQHLTQMFCSGPKTYRVANPGAAVVGERVTVAIGAGNLRRTANLAYVFPLLMAVAGAVLGASLAGDFGAIVGMLSSLALAFLYVKARSRSVLDSESDQPHIVSRS